MCSRVCGLGNKTSGICTGDRLDAKLGELKDEYGETAPGEIAEPAHKALWTYNITVEAYEEGQYGAAEEGWMAVNQWLDGGEMVVPGVDQREGGSSDGN